MGVSSTEIERQIGETRSHLDANLTVLEARVASGARRAGRIAAMVGIGLVTAVAIGAAVYMLRRRPSLSARTHDSNWRSIAEKVAESHAVPIASGLAARILRTSADTPPGAAAGEGVT